MRHLRRTGAATLNLGWACYRTELWVAAHGDVAFGVVGCAVGAPFCVPSPSNPAVSGCCLVVSVTSSGQVLPLGDPP